MVVKRRKDGLAVEFENAAPGQSEDDDCLADGVQVREPEEEVVVDGDFLVIARRLARNWIERGQKAVTDILGDTLCGLKPSPQGRRRRECLQLVFDTGEEVVLNDGLTVSGIGELQAKDLGVFLCLLKPIACRAVRGLGLNDRYRKIPAVAKEVVRTFLLPADRSVANDHDPAVSEAFLLTDLAVFPAGAVQFRQYICRASVRFAYRHF